MGAELRKRAEDVLAGAPHTGKSKAKAETGWLGPFERLALLLLSGWASDDTLLTWPGRRLRQHMGCSVNVPGPAIKRLSQLGHLIAVERPGRAPIYVIHPGGGAPLSVRAAEVKAHLKVGKFGSADQTLVLDRMAEAGLLTLGGADPVRTLTRGVTPKVGRGSASIPDPHTSSGIPSHLVCESLTRGVTETEEKPERETPAAPRPAPLGGRAGAAGEAGPWTKAEIDRMHREAAERWATERNGSIAA